MKNWSKARKALAASALVLAGFGAGTAVMVTTAATADESSTTTSRDDEVALTGDALDEVTAAVQAEYPGATIERAETDSDGVYEAHITTADDEELTVELDDTYTITGTEDHRGHGDRDGHGDEQPLTGNALDRVTAAVQAEYPGATIERTETDSDGVYEAHITTADDEELTVELDDTYTITGTEDHRGHGDRDGHGDEQPLTGNALDEVTAAVQAEYPGATIERTETDSDGVYEAHIITADDEELTVELDDTYTITGTESH